MLLRTLFVLTLFTVLGETLIHTVHALARASLHVRARSAVEAQLSVARSAAAGVLATAVAQGIDPAASPPPPPASKRACRLSTGEGCAIYASAAAAFVPAAATTPAACAAAACTVYEQANDAVAEGRIEVRIDASATSAQGEPLAARSERAVFRTMRVAPYVVLAGVADATTPAASGTGEGDDAGAVPNGTAPGSLVDVLYQNSVTGATLPANVWRPLVERPASASTAWAP